MALKYEIKTKKPGLGQNAKQMYYPVLTGRQVADTAQVAAYISKYSSLSRGDIISVIEMLTDVIPELIEANYNVKLDGLGTFSVHARSKGKEDPQKLTVRDITDLNMSFLPSKRIKEQLKGMKVVKKGSR